MYTLQKNNAAKAYANTNLESGAFAASPHKLIAMLFEGAMIAILKAEHHMKEKNIIEKSAAINKASDIILLGLDASLNMDEGSELGENLHALYTYMGQRLILANLHNDLHILREVYNLLLDLKGTWDQIAPQAAAPNSMNQAFNVGQSAPAFVPASA